MGFWKDEFKLSNCCLSYYPAHFLVRSQWQKDTKSISYFIYRWLFGIFVVAVVATTLHTHVTKTTFGSFFIYLTHWGILMNMVVGIYGLVLVTIWHFNVKFRDTILKKKTMPISFKIYWFLYNITLDLAFLITTIFWGVVYKSVKDVMKMDAAMILTHIFNSVIMFLDIIVVAHPLRLYHAIHLVFFGIVYILFSYIYYVCGGLGGQGKPYIYEILNWEHPGKAAPVAIVVVIIGMIFHILLFWIYKLRVFIYNRCFATKFILPTTAQIGDIQNKAVESL